MGDYTIAERQKRLTERRKSEGWRRVTDWIQPECKTRTEAKNELKKLVHDLEHRTVDHATALALVELKLTELINDLS